MTGGRLVYLAAVRWEETTKGTDHRLALALARKMPVLWVDPPEPIIGSATGWHPQKPRLSRIDDIGPSLSRLRTLAPPGITRPGARALAYKLQQHGLRAVLERWGTPTAFVATAATAQFPEGVAGRRILYATDDWLAGASLMRVPAKWLSTALGRNLATADTVLAVSEPLATSLTERSGRTVVVLPNGCAVSGPDFPSPIPRRPVAALAGQLNERIDLGLMEALAKASIPLEIFGPRRDRDSASRSRWDHLLARSNVTWFGELGERDLAQKLSTIHVGVTPYRDTAFNRASFPLKTLEYLAAGMRVVSTDLPAVRWLDSPFIEVGRDVAEFVRAVTEGLAAPWDPAKEQQRRDFAKRHSWDARAEELLTIAASDDLTASN